MKDLIDRVRALSESQDIEDVAFDNMRDWVDNHPDEAGEQAGEAVSKFVRGVIRGMRLGEPDRIEIRREVKKMLKSLGVPSR